MQPNILGNLENILISKDNFLLDYDKILRDSDTHEYLKDSNGIYPGVRTKNLAPEYGKDIVERALNILSPEKKEYEFNLHFHVNTLYDNDEANEGWIHSDRSHLTGIIYLTPYTIDTNAGTSFYNQKNRFLLETNLMREFFKDNCLVSDYLPALHENNSQYEVINDVPFVTNRLVMFDSRTPHKVKNYKLQNGNPRKSVLFYVNFI